MTTGVCTRCGRQGEIEYGADGLAYCSSCAFYGLNKQCWRCRMYLPASELQQYQGQFTCPYCIMDLREADRKKEEAAPSKPHLEVLALPEQCERCGRDLKGLVYIWNDKKLCKNCVSEEQEKWGIVGGGPMAAPYKITLEPEKQQKKKSLIEAIISDALRLLGLKKEKKAEIVIVGEKMPIAYAKPMTEGAIMSSKGAKAERKPQTEGIMPLRGQGTTPFELEGGTPPEKKGTARENLPVNVQKEKPEKAKKRGKETTVKQEARKKKKQ